jgi:hypothetical protein
MDSKTLDEAATWRLETGCTDEYIVVSRWGKGGWIVGKQNTTPPERTKRRGAIYDCWWGMSYDEARPDFRLLGQRRNQVYYYYEDENDSRKKSKYGI